MFKLLTSFVVALSLSACSYFPTKAEKPVETVEPTIPTPTIVPAYVIKLHCLNTLTSKESVGTAFYIGNRVFLTAYHVMNEDRICVDSASLTRMELVKTDEANDLSVITFRSNQKIMDDGFKVNCKGFKKGQVYLTMGYAGGQVFIINKLVDTGKVTKKDLVINDTNMGGMRELDGLLVQGMSGGPVVDLDGKVVGINNVTGYFGSKTYSYELKNTSICNGKK